MHTQKYLYKIIMFAFSWLTILYALWREGGMYFMHVDRVKMCGTYTFTANANSCLFGVGDGVEIKMWWWYFYDSKVWFCHLKSVHDLCDESKRLANIHALHCHKTNND